MRISYCLLTLPLVAFACTDPVKNDTAGDPASRLVTPSGVIRGTVLYQGPRPCSSNGHIVGNAILLVFDRRVPPPPNGLAATATNFMAVTGDALFANEPRWGGSDVYCPAKHGYTETITASVPFALSPLAGASYMIEAFFDTTGNFFPTFKFANLPEQGDVGGGTLDTAAALQPINQNPNYEPNFLPVEVGIPEPVPAGAPPGTIPLYDIPQDGYVADNVQVTIGSVLKTTRPYFYPEGWVASTSTSASSGSVTITTNLAQTSLTPYAGTSTGIAGSPEITSSDPNIKAHYAPVLTIPQDIHTFAPPLTPLNNLGFAESSANLFEGGGTDSNGNAISGLPHLRLRFPEGSDPNASLAAKAPYNMQLAPFTGQPSGGGIEVWEGEWLNPAGKLPDGSTGPIWQAQYIPDSVYKQAGGQPTPMLWPAVILNKLEDDPTHTLDPASLTAQGDATHPVVIMQGITLWGGGTTTASANNANPDTLYSTVSPELFSPQTYIDQSGNPTTFVQDHITVLLRPAAICFDTLFDATNSDKRGTLVAPYVYGQTTDSPPVNSAIVPLDLLTNNDPARQQITNLVKAPPNWTPGTPPAIQGCLPTGRYAINVVYPDGQAWTVPNEAGACTGNAGDTSGEGATNWNVPSGEPVTCTLQPRNVIPSQGTRAVVEIVAAKDSKNCVAPNLAAPAKANAPNVPQVPSVCLPVQQ